MTQRAGGDLVPRGAKEEPDSVLVEWRRATAKAGYLTVTIAHQP